MAESGYLLSEEDAKSLKKIIEEFNIKPQKERKYYEEERRFQTPDVHVIKTPATDISGLTVEDQTGTAEDIGHPGHAECYVYRLLYDGSEATLEKISENKKIVFNLSTKIVPKNTWILVHREKMGKWVISNSSQETKLIEVITEICPSYEEVDISVDILEIDSGVW